MMVISRVIDWIHRHRPTNPGRFVMPYLVIVLTVLIGLSLIQVKDTRDFTGDLRDGLVKSCERNGNPLREAVQEVLREQIVSAERTPASFFPNIPPATFKRLVREQRERNEAVIRRIRPVKCAALYP